MSDDPQTVKPNTGFDWLMYADATFAGISPLIPLPLIDNVFEWFFQRRIAPSIAARAKQPLSREVLKEIRHDELSCLSTCLLLPIFLTVELVKSLSRKVFYFLSITLATNRVSYYWHYAFLLRYAVDRGDLHEAPSARLARQAIRRVLSAHVQTSPLVQLAQQVVGGMNQVWRSLRLARRGKENREIKAQRSVIEEAWGSFEGYWRDVAGHYDQAYAEIAEAERKHRAAMAVANGRPVDEADDRD